MHFYDKYICVCRKKEVILQRQTQNGKYIWY